MRLYMEGRTVNMGKNAKYPMRANVFRFALQLGHCPMQSALRICANRVVVHFRKAATPMFQRRMVRRLKREVHYEPTKYFQAVCNRGVGGCLTSEQCARRSAIRY